MSKYIKLEDVQKIIFDSKCLHSTDMGVMINKFYDKRINSLPSIDFEGMIKEMIEELACSYDVETNSKIGKIAIDSHISILKEILSRLPK